jgi:glucose-1-phosphate cytidylyltransferase
MKAVILAGGLGTRISEESDLRPKPMVEIGGRPLLWHIMKMYSNHGVTDFIVCLGYKGYMVKEYFFNYYRHTSDFRINLASGNYEILNSESEDWTITFVDTGLETQTGGRLKRVKRFLDDETFCMTYGDGVSDLNISEEIRFHQAHGKKATLAAVKPPGRFANLRFSSQGMVSEFREKPEDEVGWINGGFFVLEPEVLDEIDGDSTVWERGPLESLTNTGQLAAFQHVGFWQPMDTLREMRLLQDLWAGGGAPWLSRPQSN